MRDLWLIIVLLFLLAACGNNQTNKEKLKEELKTELKAELKEEMQQNEQSEQSEQNQESKTGDFKWEGTYKFKDQTVTFKPDGKIRSTGDFPYYGYQIMDGQYSCDLNIIGLLNMGIVEFHYKREGNKIELYHVDLGDCKVKELFAVLEKQ